MTTEITRKQAVLLSVLGVVLVVVLFVQLLIRPLMTKVSEAKEQLEVLNQQYSDLLLQSQSYDQNIALTKGLEREKWRGNQEAVSAERCGTDRPFSYLCDE